MQINRQYSKSIIFTLFLLAVLSLPSPCLAEDLLSVYLLALKNDPTLQAAREAQLAAREALPQARALFLPVINGTASYIDYRKKYYANSISVSNLTIPLTTRLFHYDQGIYALSLTQPIYYYQQWVALGKATAQVKQANATFAAAEQNLILRTITAYIAVLRAIDSLSFAKSQYSAFAKLLEQTEARFKAGITNTITDVQLAKARRDTAYSQIILAENSVAVQKKLLQEITCEAIETFQFLRDDICLTKPEPEKMEDWICLSLEQNLDLQAARFLVEATREDVKLNRANHLPTINIESSYIRSGPTHDIFSLPGNTNTYIGVQAAIPIFSGGSIVSKTRQARHIYEQNFRQMEAQYRQVESSASQAYLGVLTQLSQIEALKQTVLSNKTALESVETTLKAGTQYTIVDVLNAQSDLIKSRQDLANARYDYLLQSVQLKNAAGVLCPIDVEQINNWLK